MDGLSNVIDKIKEDNEKTCDKIIAAAKAQASQIESDMKKKAEIKRTEILKEAEAEAELIEQKGKNAAIRERENILLSKKNEFIDDVIAKAQEYLISSKSYSHFIVNKAVSGACEGVGVISFNQKDLNEIGANVVEVINKKLKDGKSVKLSDTPMDIKGGFVLNYDFATINESVEELVSQNKDKIRDKVQEFVFGV